MKTQGKDTPINRKSKAQYRQMIIDRVPPAAQLNKVLSQLPHSGLYPESSMIFELQMTDQNKQVFGNANKLLPSLRPKDQRSIADYLLSDPESAPCNTKGIGISQDGVIVYGGEYITALLTAPEDVIVHIPIQVNIPTQNYRDTAILNGCVTRRDLAEVTGNREEIVAAISQYNNATKDLGHKVNYRYNGTDISHLYLKLPNVTDYAFDVVSQHFFHYFETESGHQKRELSDHTTSNFKLDKLPAMIALAMILRQTLPIDKHDYGTQIIKGLLGTLEHPKEKYVRLVAPVVNPLEKARRYFVETFRAQKYLDGVTRDNNRPSAFLIECLEMAVAFVVWAQTGKDPMEYTHHAPINPFTKTGRKYIHDMPKFIRTKRTDHELVQRLRIQLLAAYLNCDVADLHAKQFQLDKRDVPYSPNSNGPNYRAYSSL